MIQDKVRTGETLIVRECTMTPPKGMVFSHWNTKEDGTGVNYKPGQKIKMFESVKLYPIWTEVQE